MKFCKNSLGNLAKNYYHVEIPVSVNNKACFEEKENIQIKFLLRDCAIKIRFVFP